VAVTPVPASAAWTRGPWATDTRCRALVAAGGDAPRGDGARSRADQTATTRRERPPSSAAARAAPQRQTADPDADGPRALGVPRRPGPRLAARPAPCPAPDAAALAPHRVPRALATQGAPTCSASTSPSSTGYGRTRALAKGDPSRHQRRTGVARGQYTRCRSWPACIMPTSAPRRVGGCIFSQHSGHSRSSVASTTRISAPRSADGQTKRPGQGYCHVKF
jgi:hypothetical protein